MARLYLIRHGKPSSSWGEHDEDPGLDDTGRAQAAAVGEIPTPKALSAEARPGWLQKAFQGTWAGIEGDLNYDVWRAEIVASLVRRGNTAVFSHYVAINGAVSKLLNDDRVLAFRPDHTSITILETDGKTLTLVAKGAEASTGVL